MKAVLCAFATALTTAGICVGGFWGKALIILGLLGNLAWLVVTFVEWWQRAPYGHRRIVWTVTVVYGAGWFTVRAAAGPFAAWILGFAVIGYVATITGVLMTTGYLAASHAKRTQVAIATGKVKEITR